MLLLFCNLFSKHCIIKHPRKDKIANATVNKNGALILPLAVFIKGIMAYLAIITPIATNLLDIIKANEDHLDFENHNDTNEFTFMHNLKSMQKHTKTNEKIEKKNIMHVQLRVFIAQNRMCVCVCFFHTQKSFLTEYKPHTDTRKQKIQKNGKPVTSSIPNAIPTNTLETYINGILLISMDINNNICPKLNINCAIAKE